MDKYMIVLQICAILFICFIVYFLFKFIVSLIKRNRLSYFSLDLVKDKYSEENEICKIFYKFSDLVKSLVVFNGLAKTYDKYVYEDGRLRKGMDFISLKIISGFLFVLLYLVLSFLYKSNFNTFLIIIFFVFGFFLVDFYCFYNERRRFSVLNKSILSAIIVMSNSYKSNRNMEQAILDVIDRTDSSIKNEFKKILNDLKLGINISDAFFRMYNRTKIEILLYISSVLVLYDKNKINLIEVFGIIENKMLSEEKFLNRLKTIKEINNLARLLFILLPFVFIVAILVFNIEYMDMMLSDNGIIVLSVVLIIYFVYILIINKVVRGSNYEK